MNERLPDLWLNHAIDDLDSAEVLLEAKISNMVCFHSQQAVEKLFKAYIASHSNEIPKIHNLIRLQAICEDLAGEEFSINDEEIIFLNDVYIDSRYPADFGLLPSGKPSMKDAQKALRIAQKIDSLFRPIVKSRL
jgi:HEPN domain-containing protein